MPKRAGIAVIILGAVLIISALLLYFYNRNEDEAAGAQAESMLSDIRSAIFERSAELSPVPSPPESTAAETPELDPEMPIAEIDGYGYVGYVSIPAIEIELPVMADWDYNRLKIAPCRQFGSSRTDDLVIAAHNYQTHFKKLSQLQPGDSVVFTDMDGIENSYTVVESGTLAPTEVEAVQNSGHDLVLYTCTYGGATRVVVFCDRTEADGEG